MSRHGRSHQPRSGNSAGDPTGSAAGDGGAPGPAEGTLPEPSPAPAAERVPEPQGGPGPGDPPRSGSTAAGGAVPQGGRVRVNDGTKVTPLADEDDLEEVPAAGGRFSAWRRHRQERAATRTLTASRLPPEDEPARGGSTAVGATVVAFPASPGARRRRRRIGAVLGLLAALAVLAGVLFLSPVLAVRDVTVRGAELTDPARVESALDVYRGVPLTRISKDEVRDRVGQIPQVRSIEVLLEPPHHLVVALHERVPVAAIEDGDEFVVVDSEGVELMTAGSAADAGVPVVTGGRDVLESERFETISDVLAALPESVLAQLRTASAESLSSVELVFTDGRTVVWGTAEDSELKSQVLRELVEARGSGSGVETYDVSSPTRPVVR
ncbi:UNVERIFIED_CONTAM: FtsQ-type POTRA domain-containing protein [Kocuria sp. CPCC 205316]|uniref:cell division protein FtsQ/DivIB n=1 Tax=Kocuria TaxID=57493 RepID=UPI0036DDE502